MDQERRQLEAAIAALDSQRALLGDAVVDAMLAAARDKLASPTPARATAPQRLRQLSILFVDVVGSTRFAQHLDPEEIATVMDDALARATKRVEAHGGRTLQYAGDSLLAAFGADEAREDDPERAVRCGLDLLALGRQLRGEVESSHRHSDFNFRIGIHTGDVLVGSDIADGSIRGLAVNIAARMEQTAPPGRLRISHPCHAQLRGVFEVEAQPPLTIKGIDEPVRSYLVLRAKPRTFRRGTRGIDGVSTRMIGRDAELEVLQAAFTGLFQEGALDVVTVSAEAGIGKSRLLQEFHDWSDARAETFVLFQGRASPQTQGQPFGLLRDILAWRFEIADDDTVDVARQKLERGLVPLFEDEGLDRAVAHAHLLGHLIGIEWRDSPHIRGILDDPKQLRNRAFHAAAQLFRRLNGRLGRTDAGRGSCAGSAPGRRSLPEHARRHRRRARRRRGIPRANGAIVRCLPGCGRPARGDFGQGQPGSRVGRPRRVRARTKRIDRGAAPHARARRPRRVQSPAAARAARVVGRQRRGGADPRAKGGGRRDRGRRTRLGSDRARASGRCRTGARPSRRGGACVRASARDRDRDRSAGAPRSGRGAGRVALARGDFAAARRTIDYLVRLNATAGAVTAALENTDSPRLVELTCYRVLDRAGDSRALDWLRRAHEGVSSSAAHIRDPVLRDGYLRNVPHNRAIVAAWSRLQAPST